MKISALKISALAMASAAISVPNSATAQSTGSLPGAQFRAIDQSCPETSYSPMVGTEGVGALAAGLLSSFAGKALDAFSAWLKKRDERLDGTRTGTYTGEFYDANKPFAQCYIFEAANFGPGEGSSNQKVYAEFVPVYFSDGAFTLKPVYLRYAGSVARAGRNRDKYTSLVVNFKYNTPTAKNESGAIVKSELKDGPVFTFNFGKIRPGSAAYDYQALAGIQAGLGQLAPAIPDADDPELFRPISYEATALWSESAEPSPLYTAAVDAFGDNTDEIGTAITKVINDALGVQEDDKD